MMGIILPFKWDSHGPGGLQLLSVYGVEWCTMRKSEMNFNVFLQWFFTQQQFTSKQKSQKTDH